MKYEVIAPFITLSINASPMPIYRQVYEALRQAILSGQFGANSRLPSTRALAQQLGVSRLTVVSAYEQLLAEGYTEGKTGAGTYIASSLPDGMLQVQASGAGRIKEATKNTNRHLSERGRWLTSNVAPKLRVLHKGNSPAFQYGMPAVDEFPFDVWARLASRRLKNPPRELLDYGDPAGYRPLREAVAAYLKSARAVQCDTDQVIIVAGTQQALYLTAQVLLDADDAAWIEDPCYPGTRGALHSVGAKILSVPVDDEGFNLSAALKRNKNARLAFVTPSHQFPLGITMSLSRRLALLEWASQAQAWIVEDDYDSEYRYAGRPLASLQGLDKEGRVIYIGTFSKTIFPALRLGCMVVPHDLIDTFTAARALVDRHSPSLDQVILTDFIEQGHFARHIRRMRVLYAERQAVLVTAAKKYLEGMLEVTAAESGMHIVGWLPENISDKVASERAAREGVQAAPLSPFCTEPLPRGGLILGFTSVNPKQIKDGVRRMARALI